MSVRVMVMEDGRTRESEGGEHDMDELLVLLLSAVAFENKWRDQFPRLVTKGLCAPVISLLKSLEQGSFRLSTIFFPPVDDCRRSFRLSTLPSIAAFPFPIVSICPTISCIHLATSYTFTYLLFVANPSASALALEAAPAQHLLLQELLQEELVALQPLPQLLLPLPPPLKPHLQLRTLRIV
jgi:hypothetical protein